MSNDAGGLQPRTGDSTVEVSPTKKIELAQPVTVDPESTRQKLDVGWGEERMSLLGIWMTVFISVYVTLMVKSETSSWFRLLAYASFSGLFAFIMLLPFRSGSVRKAFFKFYDWVSGKEEANFRAFAVVLTMTVLFFLFLLLYWAFG